MTEYRTDWGEVDDPTVILLHPAGGTRHNWTPHAEQLRDDYHVVALDLPGHGVHPEQEFSFDRAVEDVSRVLGDVDSAVVGGHSQGGYVASRVAAKYDTTVDGLILGGASYRLRSPKLLAISGLQYPLSYVLELVDYSDRASEWVLDTAGGETTPKQEPPEDERTHSTLHGTAESIRASCFAKHWPYIKEYDGPVIAAHGNNEMMGDHAEQLATHDGVQIQWYAGDHQAPMTNPDEFTSIIESFLHYVNGRNKQSMSASSTA